MAGIEARFQQTAHDVNAALTGYRFHEAANLVYEFFWGDLCAWYIEAVKLRLDVVGAAREQSRAALHHLVRMFEGSLRLLSPFMPFISEEIWHALYQQKTPAKSIALTRFPQGAELSKVQKSAIEHMQIVQNLIVDIRNRRAELKVEPKQRVQVRIFTTPATQRLIESNRELIEGAMDDLPVHFREILLLCEVEEMSYQEIAETLSVPIGTVMSRLSRARRSLRDRLRPPLQESVTAMNAKGTVTKGTNHGL